MAARESASPSGQHDSDATPSTFSTRSAFFAILLTTNYANFARRHAAAPGVFACGMGRNSKWIESKPDDTVRRIARRALSARLERVWHYLELSVWEPNEAENVHQLRVFSRRAGAALHIFEAWLPPRRGRWIQKHVKRLREAAGDARDLDVLWMRWAERVTQNPSGQAALVLEEIKTRRRQAQEPIEAIFKKLTRKRFDRKAEKFLKRVRHRGDVDKCGERFECMARESLERLVVPYLAAAEAQLSDDQALHSFRIQGKQVRYAMEIFAGAFDAAFREELYPFVASLQERLGTINDFVTARVHLAAWRDAADACPLRQALEAGLDQEQVGLETARSEFLAWWTPERRADLRRRFTPYVQLAASERPFEAGDGSAA
jgi:CHAD domain-containing protein